MGVGYDTYDAEATTIAETLSGIDIAYNVGKMSGGSFDRGVTQGGNGGDRRHRQPRVRNGLGGSSDHWPDRLTHGPDRAGQWRSAVARAAGRELVGRILSTGLWRNQPARPRAMRGASRSGQWRSPRVCLCQGKWRGRIVVISREQLPDATSRDAMEKIGLETMTVSFAASYDWNVAEKRMSLRDTMLKVNELGTVALSAELTNLAAEIADFGQARLAHARLRFETRRWWSGCCGRARRSPAPPGRVQAAHRDPRAIGRQCAWPEQPGAGGGTADGR